MTRVLRSMARGIPKWSSPISDLANKSEQAGGLVHEGGVMRTIACHTPCSQRRCSMQSLASGDSKIRMGTDLRRFKGQHDAVMGDPCLHQLFRDTIFCAVVLDPDLLLANIDMQHAAVNTIRAMPASVHEFVVIVDRVKDHLYLYVTMCWFILGVLLDEGLNDLTIGIHVVHLTITSWCGSKARQATASSSRTGRAIGSSNVLPKTLWGIARNSFRSGSSRARRARWKTY